jgi:hypothetical protein
MAALAAPWSVMPSVNWRKSRLWMLAAAVAGGPDDAPTKEPPARGGQCQRRFNSSLFYLIHDHCNGAYMLCVHVVTDASCSSSCIRYVGI